MNQFDLFVDSAANIPDEMIRQRNITVIPYTCLVNGEERLCVESGVPFEQTAKKFYDDMRRGLEIKTSLITAERISEALEPTLCTGKDALVVTISSGISGTYQQALQAKKDLEERYPKCRVFVADSANASMGEGLLALKAADLRDMGESIETCANWVKDNAYQMNSYFTVSDLKYLRRGGRISATLAFAGSLLNIKPVLRADGSTNAKISFFGRERGRKKALAALAQAFRDNAVYPDTQTVSITHADCEEDALELEAMLREAGAKHVIIEYYDLCTGSHVGPGTVALFFKGKDRRGDAAAAAEAERAKNSLHAKHAPAPVK